MGLTSGFVCALRLSQSRRAVGNPARNVAFAAQDDKKPRPSAELLPYLAPEGGPGRVTDWLSSCRKRRIPPAAASMRAALLCRCAVRKAGRGPLAVSLNRPRANGGIAKKF